VSVVRWCIGLAVFGVVLLFALQNADLVSIRFYHWLSWQAPLIVLLLFAFAAGAFAGLLAGLMRTTRLKRQVSRMRRAQLREPAPAPPDQA
jgi:uncharacterized integral membrane protein